jgi:hypothetical protein
MQQYERKETILCTFDKGSPKITAYEIHEWIYNKLQLDTEDVVTLQIDGPKRQVFIKTKHSKVVEDMINRTKGELMYVHDSGETSRVIISQAGLGRRNVRIANLPPEMPGEIIRKHMENTAQLRRYRRKNGPQYIDIMSIMVYA